MKRRPTTSSFVPRRTLDFADEAPTSDQFSIASPPSDPSCYCLLLQHRSRSVTVFIRIRRCSQSLTASGSPPRCSLLFCHRSSKHRRPSRGQISFLVIPSSSVCQLTPSPSPSPVATHVRSRHQRRNQRLRNHLRSSRAPARSLDLLQQLHRRPSSSLRPRRALTAIQDLRLSSSAPLP